jgi:hypothetical protein
MMKAGSVAVAADGSYAGTDLAKALMDAHVAAAETLLQAQLQPLQALFPGAGSDPKAKVAVRQGLAAMANAYASTLVAYLQANARAHVTTEVLARAPAPVGSTPLDLIPPAAPVDLPIV